MSILALLWQHWIRSALEIIK